MTQSETLHVNITRDTKNRIASQTWDGLGQIRDIARQTRLEQGFVKGASIVDGSPVSSDIIPGTEVNMELGMAYDQVTGAQAIPLVQAHVHPNGLFRFSPDDVSQWSGVDKRIIVPVSPDSDVFNLDLKQTENHRPLNIVVALHNDVDRVVALAQTRPDVDLAPFAHSGLNPAMVNMRHRKGILEATLRGEEPDFAALYGIALLVTTLNAEGKNDFEAFIQDHVPDVITLKPYQLEL